MGKTGKALKRRRLAAAEAQVPLSPVDDGDDSDHVMHNDPQFLQGLVTSQELLTTVRTLNTLTRYPELLKNKNELKGVRGAVFDFQRVSANVAGTGNTLTSRISAALSSSRYTDALVLLSELQIRKLVPKLGALQRWVRDCDAASRSDGSFGDPEVLRVIDAILRCTNGNGRDDLNQTTSPILEPVCRKAEWTLRDPLSTPETDIWAEVKDATFPSLENRTAIAASFFLLEETPGAERLPPNQHPALLFASRDSAIPLAAPSTQVVSKHLVPHVPGAFLLADVLSADECRSIIGAAESIGFAPDQPIEEKSSNSVLAHNLYWLADVPFLTNFVSRFRHLLPLNVSGGTVTGLNARFRVYRYVPGAIYRPHVDGAWPKSGIDPVTGKYLYDSSPKDEPEWSRLTFLIYLNDGFKNGCTTFFLPSSDNGVMNAYPVKPIAGCALVFPHGDAAGSLLHEGSPVGENGAKYVIRTEVLYTVAKKETGLEVAEV